MGVASERMAIVINEETNDKPKDKFKTMPKRCKHPDDIFIDNFRYDKDGPQVDYLFEQSTNKEGKHIPFFYLLGFFFYYLCISFIDGTETKDSILSSYHPLDSNIKVFLSLITILISTFIFFMCILIFLLVYAYFPHLF